MDPRYTSWIQKYVESEKGYVAGSCGHATTLMCEAFPELRRVGGFVTVPLRGNDLEHWWCVTPDGEIVDPTAAQFGGFTPHYQPFKPGDEVRTGRCMNCGADIYRRVQSLSGDRECICSDECAKELFEPYPELEPHLE